MTSLISKVKFVAKAEIFAPKYFKDELIQLQDSGAVTMIQIPGFLPNTPKPAAKIVVGINKDGQIMNNPKKDIVVMPCPNFCEPPGSGGLVTLSSFLNN